LYAEKAGGAGDQDAIFIRHTEAKPGIRRDFGAATDDLNVRER
jgi:hypothetical protein